MGVRVNLSRLGACRCCRGQCTGKVIVTTSGDLRSPEWVLMAGLSPAGVCEGSRGVIIARQLVMGSVKILSLGLYIDRV